MAAAQRVDQAIADGTFDTLGPLAGVPVAFKDNMNMAGTHTTCSSRMLENYVSPYTATCVQRIIDAGGVPLGKLNMDEFAFGGTTETSRVRPHAQPVGAGPRSGRLARAARRRRWRRAWPASALGSATRAAPSASLPASAASWASSPPTAWSAATALVAFGSSLDQVGPFARSVADAALRAGRHVRAATRWTARRRTSKRRLRRAVMPSRIVRGHARGRGPQLHGSAEGLSLRGVGRVSVEAAAQRCAAWAPASSRSTCPHCPMPPSAPTTCLGPCEAFSNLARFDGVRYGYCDAKARQDLGSQYEASRAHGFGEEAKPPHHAGQLPAFRRRVRAVLLSGPAGPHAHHAGLPQRLRAGATSSWRPRPRATAFKFGEIADPATMYLSDVFTISINIAGNGGMSVPCGLGAQSGMPVGVQLICPAVQGREHVPRRHGARGRPTAKPPWPRTSPTGRWLSNA